VGRLIVDTPELRERVQKMGICDHRRVYTAEDLAPGNQLIVAASGVTTGTLLTGVRFFAAGYRTHSLVMTRSPNEVRFMDGVHLTDEPGPKGIRLY
jgi:fructose-1,6-bisphosphatase/sedoheptulose 1,7-bisphosphatase-like protein